MQPHQLRLPGDSCQRSFAGRWGGLCWVQNDHGGPFSGAPRVCVTETPAQIWQRSAADMHLRPSPLGAQWRLPLHLQVLLSPPPLPSRGRGRGRSASWAARCQRPVGLWVAGQGRARRSPAACGLCRPRVLVSGWEGFLGGVSPTPTRTEEEWVRREVPGATLGCGAEGPTGRAPWRSSGRRGGAGGSAGSRPEGECRPASVGDRWRGRVWSLVGETAPRGVKRVALCRPPVDVLLQGD